MHGCSSGSAVLVNAEVDSMGGVVDAGVGIGIKTSPRQAAIEKAQAELRLEYDVREERRRELEFLEKGGNPLDFKFGNAASVSVQSTSLMDQHPENEAKGSFALTASPRGDSVESSGRPGAPTVCEPNTADNLLLFDGESEFAEVERNSVHPNRSNVIPSEQSSQLDGSLNAKESGDSAPFGVPKKAYRRRNRSRPNRDGACSSSTDIVPSRGGRVSYLPSRHGLKDVKGAVSDTNNQKDQNVPSNCNLKPASPNASMVPKAVTLNSQLDMKLDDVRAVDSATELNKDGPPECVDDFNTSKNLQNDQHSQPSQIDAQESPICMTSGLPEPVGVGGREQVVSAGLECPPCVTTAKVENQTNFTPLNGFNNAKGDRKSIPNEAQNSSAALSTKGLDSESSCTKTSLSLEGNNDSGLCTNLRNIDSNGTTREQTLVFEENPNIEGDESVKEKNETKAEDSCAFSNDDRNSVHQSHQDKSSILKDEEVLHGSDSSLQNELKNHTGVERMEPDGQTACATEREPSNLLGDNSVTPKENACINRPQCSMDSSISELPETTLSVRSPTVAPEQQIHLKLANKANEDSILEEARIIEAKRKRIAELSVGTLPMENHQKSHWDLVLEEMAWLANDFAQERLWKITAAAQICRRVAFTSRLRFEEENLLRKQKNVAHTLSKAIMEFWHTAEETSNGLELQCPGKKFALAIQEYAVKYLKYNSSIVPLGRVETPVTPEGVSDLGIQEVSWEDHFTEENLFYTVPPGAIETYRKSIESYLVQCEKTGSSMQEEVETSIYDAVADFGIQENAYEEDEGETSTYLLHGNFEGSKASNFAQKKRKKLTHSYGARSYELGADLPYMQCMENKVGTQQSVLMGKHPANSLNVGSIPTKKRVRTAASRQRVRSPFSAGTSGCVQAPNRTDASSDDTNSFQDDQSTLHGMQNSLEFESAGDFEKQLPFDSAEVSTRPRKKKKAKHLGSTYEQRWQLDPNFQNEQRDHSRKRLESYQLESNGSSGLFGQQIIKKPKLAKQSLDNSFDNLTPLAGSIPSPVASQMSNMPNPNKFIKLLGGRDRGRKAKATKMPVGLPGSGSEWSLFEEQALVVLVHDLGPNWELVSDAINSTLQFKCIFRKPKECKEHHSRLIDRTNGDGADSAEDSGSSQPYPSTLPGIPKGSARQLFQRLQGPMEEETLKSHFEKIIVIGQNQHYRRTQNDSQDIKPIQPHNSHSLALSQVCPNNVNGPPLTDGRYGVPRTAALSIDEQQKMQQYNQMLSGRTIQQSSSSIPGTLPGTDRSVRMLPGGNGLGMMGVNRSMPMARPGFQGMASSSMLNSGSMLSSSMVAIPGPVNMHSGAGSGQGSSMLRPRDALHMMRPTQNPEHQRQMMVPDLQMHATQGNGQGVPPFGTLSSAFSNQAAPSPVQTYPHQQQHHMSPQQSHVLSNPHHSHQGPNQAYAIRLAKERHLQQQQRLLQQQQQQQQQQFAASNSLMSHVQTQPQLPISSSLQNSSQVQSQTSSPPVPLSSLAPSSTMTPMSQNQQKHHIMPHGLGRNPQTGGGGLTNQMGKQRQLQAQQQQQLQQSGRHHPQHRQHSQSQQQTKLSKGIGRGNMQMHQSLSIDPSLLNGLITTPGSQSAEKGEQGMHLMQGQGLYSGSGLNPVQPSKPLVPHSSNVSQPQQKMYPAQTVSSSKQLQLPSSHPDNGDQGHLQPVASGPTLSASHQAVPPLVIASSNHQQPHQKLVNQTQPAVQRVLQQNRQVNSNPQSKLQVNQAQGDQQPVTNSSQMSNTVAMPQACADRTNVVPVISSTSTSQRKAPEPLYDSGMSHSTTQLVPIESPPLTSSAGSEPTLSVSQGLDQRQSSGSLPHIGHNVSAQGHQQHSLLQPPPTPPPQQLLQQQSPQQQLPPQQQSRQQMQHLEAGNNSLYIRPTNSRLE
ncbi:chromatin modification-related protein EAF1 B-like isoform X2 [Cornus florida]|uniref:chromatin modification-related protein EAF1 B-like isoform X2 n=1 Tax=Cornus florida TaxID=4283 RepID=UPI0028969D62|nr:chromatin modification-related protein EAF1 B-like isoform X2 [Cornus florida]